MHIEWEQHLFSRWTSWFPFAVEAPYLPDVRFLPASPAIDYIRSLDARGIDAGVIVQPEPYGQDHRLLLYCLALEQQRFKAACLCVPGDPAAIQKLETLVHAEPRIVAQRFHAFRGRKPYFQNWTDKPVVSLWHKAGELGLIIELHISPEQAPMVDRCLDSLPGYPVIIDHLCEPGLGSPAEYAAVMRLARYPHVHMKLSSLARIGRELGSREALQQLVSRVVEAFGAERLVWGGGTLEELDALLIGLDGQQRDLIKGGNLERLLRWEIHHAA